MASQYYDAQGVSDYR